MPWLVPDLWLESVCQLTADRLSRLGLSGVLLDVDNTVKDHGASSLIPSAERCIRSWLDAGIGVCLLSNGRSQRIGRLARQLGVCFVAKAFKPSPLGCLRAAAQLRLNARSLAVVGDQVFADIVAGRLAGMYTVLVTPTSRNEPWFTRLKRPLERKILRRPDVRSRFESASNVALDCSSTPGKY